MDRDNLNKLGAIILDSCIAIHRELRVGLLECAYSLALLRELELRNIFAVGQFAIEMNYKSVNLGKVYVIDILVENEIVLELKYVDELHPTHEAQLITYLKIADKNLGI
jgi:GxxExxY protein